MPSLVKDLIMIAKKSEPSVAKPYSPENVVPVREVQGTEIDKAYIGMVQVQSFLTPNLSQDHGRKKS